MNKLVKLTLAGLICAFGCKSELNFEKDKFYPIAVGADSTHFYYFNSAQLKDKFYYKSNPNVYTTLTSEQKALLKDSFNIDESTFKKYLIK